MVKQLETELPSRRAGLALEVGRRTSCCCTATTVLLDGVEVQLSPAPAGGAARAGRQPRPRGRRGATLLATLPSGTAGSEHAVEMAVARLRAALGTRAVQTVVKRGYRLAVAS